MREECLVYLTIQLIKNYNLEKKHLIIDEFYKGLCNVGKDFLKKDNKDLSLLDSIDEYLNNNKVEVLEMIKDSFSDDYE